MKINYVMVPQSVCNEKFECNLAGVIHTAAKISSFQQLEFSDIEMKARWGTAVYEIKPDGSLRMANHKFDTSG